MRILKNITDEFWWDVANKCEYATFFHTPIWRDLVMRIFPGRYRDETFGAILPNGVRVVLPLTHINQRIPLRRLESSFAGGYGGIIADGPVTPAEITQVYNQVRTWQTYSFYVVDNPLSTPLPDSAKDRANVVFIDAAYTIILNSDFDTIFSRFSATMRRYYRNGIKKGVKIRLAESLSDCQAYYLSYRDAVDRWGEDDSYGYGSEQFAQIYELSQIYPENIKFWMMSVDGQLVGGRIMFYWGKQATLWNGSARREFLDYYVMPVADTEIIRDAITKGYTYFDFSTCAGKQGLKDYKLRFGSTPVPIEGWLYENPLISSSRALYKSVRHRLSARRSERVVMPASAAEGTSSDANS